MHYLPDDFQKTKEMVSAMPATEPTHFYLKQLVLLQLETLEILIKMRDRTGGMHIGMGLEHSNAND